MYFNYRKRFYFKGFFKNRELKYFFYFWFDSCLRNFCYCICICDENYSWEIEEYLYESEFVYVMINFIMIIFLDVKRRGSRKVDGFEIIFMGN